LDSKIKGTESNRSKEEKFIVRMRVAIPLNNRKEPLIIIRIAIIVIPIGLLIFINNLINTLI
jgi:hypothetical protein